MTTGKAMIFLGGAGFFVCLGLILLDSQELGESARKVIGLEKEAIRMSHDIAPLRAEVRESRLVISIPENALFFAFDDSTLTDEAQSKLRIISKSVRDRYREYEVRVIGHTDSQGDSIYNRHLGQRRADAVALFLVGRGLAAHRLQGVSMGEAAPLVSNDSEEGRAINRRVEINILPLVMSDISADGTGGTTPKEANAFVEVLQKHPFFVILGCLSSCISVAGGVSELNNYRRRRRRSA